MKVASELFVFPSICQEKQNQSLQQPPSLSIESKMIGDMEMSQEESWPALIGNLMLLKEVPGGALGGGECPPRPNAQGETQVTLNSALLPGPEVILQI